MRKEKMTTSVGNWYLVFYNPAWCTVTSANIVWLERPEYNLEEMGKIDAAL